LTTAVDTNVLLDLSSTSAEHYGESVARFAQAAEQGEMVISEVVYAELSPGYTERGGTDSFLSDLGVRIQRSNTNALHVAGVAFQAYRRQRTPQTCASCGQPIAGRRHILPDFMIGAHAQVHAGRLLTRDRGYYAKYFPDLILV
jgi:predicted nucleic acid-binding protein